MTRAEDGAALIWCPFPDRDSARAVAGQMLDHGHIACANIIAAIESVFLWQGERETGTETGVLFKTTAARLTIAVEQLGKLHPYDTPAIIGWHCDAAHPATGAWLAAALGGGAQAKD
ncbi:divalent cation tolerance protein CutA [Erythrobacter sp.]|uniref:divalent-cation tolerance protein CutA n=1 Tax=Erythrobacter sp. TaxID=1042 RepID=UPI0025D98406|nr:divalent cation tolerance protein CutA [Erythrobacter sp.]